MSRNIKVSDMGILSKKLMTAKILEKRDKVAQQAKLSGNSALMAWQSTAPIRTGRMRSTMRLDSNKSTAQLVPKDSYMEVVNSVNKRTHLTTSIRTPFLPTGILAIVLWFRYRNIV